MSTVRYWSPISPPATPSQLSTPRRHGRADRSPGERRRIRVQRSIRRARRRYGDRRGRRRRHGSAPTRARCGTSDGEVGPQRHPQRVVDRWLHGDIRRRHLLGGEGVRHVALGIPARRAAPAWRPRECTVSRIHTNRVPEPSVRRHVVDFRRCLADGRANRAGTPAWRGEEPSDRGPGCCEQADGTGGQRIPRTCAVERLVSPTDSAGRSADRFRRATDRRSGHRPDRSSR